MSPDPKGVRYQSFDAERTSRTTPPSLSCRLTCGRTCELS
jgi:hypothetical protein